MIFQFPDLETFRLAVTSGAVPPAVSLAAAEVAADAAGHLSVKPAGGIPPKPMQNALKKLGVKADKQHVGEPEQVSCWPQAMPLIREAGTPELSASAPVLFELPVEALPELVGEMLRLGNDRQSFRHLESADGTGGQRVLLRVIGPPYYTLLRALDRLDVGGARVAAYAERSPNVWVEVGYTHPLVAYIQPPPGQLLLMRPPGRWTFLGEAPFHDVYEVLDFRLPESTVDWQDAELPGKLTVPLRLVAGNAADVAEMWVLRQDAVEQLDALVRDADERLMARLAFAVAEDADGKTIVLRTRPSKLPPPVLTLEGAAGFKPYWKLPNLFLPVGRRLQPMLRRDAVRKLLAEDPGQVVWLMPEGADGFVPESLPDEAFRPLEDWVHYVIDHDRQPLAAWVQATHFDFDSFLCKDEQSDKPKGPPGDRGKRRRPGDRDEGPDGDEPIDVPVVPGKGGRKKGGSKSGEDAYAAPVAAPPNELKKKREEIEESFRQIEGPLDAPERLALWPDLAGLNAALGEHNDAAICWSNALWERDETPPGWAEAWARAEVGGLKAEADDPLAVIDRALASPSPSPGELRAFVAALLWASTEDPVPEGVARRLAGARKFLEAHESRLGVRAVWLAWLHLTRLSGADVLGLARARDRLLQRLLDEPGLNKERDLPTFLRLAGVRDSTRVRAVREKSMRLLQLALKWVTFDQPEDTRRNQAYTNLLFAFGTARLGEATSARDLINAAAEVLSQERNALGEPDAAHRFLLEAFTYRVEQALAGRPHAGPLSQELRDEFERLSAQNGKQLPKKEKDVRDMVPYLIERMREQSRVLEPQEKSDPYRRWKRQSDPRLNELAELPDVKDPAELQRRINKLLAEVAKGKLSPEVYVSVLGESLPLAPRVGEAFTTELLMRVPAALDGAAGSTDPQLFEKLGALLERALFQAAHFDRTEQVQALTGRFLELLKGKQGKALHEAVNLLAGECLHSLRKVGLREEIHGVLTQMAGLVLQGQSLAQLRARHAKDWIETVTALLHLSAGWLYFGQVDTALPYLDEARLVLLDAEGLAKSKQNISYVKLARTYASTLGLGPVDLALGRIEEMFRRMARLPNSYTSATHYSRFHLAVIEEVVLSVVSDEFALGPTARRWLDDDEFLVRRRIHRDMKRHLAHSGL